MLAVIILTALACSPTSHGPARAAHPGRAVIRITGSDTMVNLVQAWVERDIRRD
jgi:ABC-type phosphate transport system substrate-binding protein